jgi:hypothetical protein
LICFFEYGQQLFFLEDPQSMISFKSICILI